MGTLTSVSPVAVWTNPHLMAGMAGMSGWFAKTREMKRSMLQRLSLYSYSAFYCYYFNPAIPDTTDNHAGDT
jgi:hypothetical protein